MGMSICGTVEVSEMTGEKWGQNNRLSRKMLVKIHGPDLAEGGVRLTENGNRRKNSGKNHILSAGLKS